ncbi:MAG: ribosome biogenesis factor YjgA [Pseudohongiellaceae bacterium]
MMNDATSPPDDESPPSKTRRKRDVEAAQDLGKALLTLRPRQLEALDLPDELLIALREYQRLPNSHEAKRRQLQFIGRVMRNLDHQAVGEAMEKQRKPDPAETRRGRCIEHWAECLLSGAEGGADRVGEFLASHPAAERQAMRQLLRNCRQDNPKARRRLLDYLNAHINADSPAPSLPGH